MIKTNKQTRRDFLKKSSLLGAFAITQICGLRTTSEPQTYISTSIPTTSPTKSSTSPLATPTTAAPSATATQTPTEAATISPTVANTDTPVPPPTDTPTPVPTPYPPGPPSKLGLFITRNDSQVLDLITQGQPALVKTLELDANFVVGIKQASPKTILVGRIWLEQMNLDADPIALAQAFVNQLLPIANDPKRLQAFDGWEAYNEPIADNPDKMKRLADFEAERTRLLAEHGIRSVVGNFATGHPHLPWWSEFVPALAAVQQYQGYLGLHEYSAPIMQFGTGTLQLDGQADEGDEGWLTLRYRKAYRQYLQPMGFGDVPILMTECGVDGLVSNRPGPADAGGWQDFVPLWLANGLRNHPPGVYMDQLIWYDSELQKDDYVKGAAIFAAGASPGWESYEILGETATLLGQYLKVHPR